MLRGGRVSVLADPPTPSLHPLCLSKQLTKDASLSNISVPRWGRTQRDFQQGQQPMETACIPCCSPITHSHEG